MTRGVAAARAALEQLLGSEAAARQAELEPLAGGTQRRSWLVRLADRREAVLRMPRPHSNALLDAATEARAMSAAAAAGIAPAVVAMNAETGALLTDFSAGAPWTTADVREAANLERLAEVLRALHALPTQLPVFAAERIATRYLGELPLGSGEPRAAAWGGELMTLARRYDATYAPTAFCHNDLIAANVLDAGELVLVDFEYASRAAPDLDLANLIAMNGLGAEHHRAVAAAYRRSTPSAAELADLQWLVRMVRFMAWFWALLGAAKAEDPSLYAPYLADFGAHLQRT
jgi:thiamine kinase-like enzyme